MSCEATALFLKDQEEKKRETKRARDKGKEKRKGDDESVEEFQRGEGRKGKRNT
jgi:hypothetical protein